MYTCTCICIYVYILREIETETETETAIEAEIDRQRQRSKNDLVRLGVAINGGATRPHPRRRQPWGKQMVSSGDFHSNAISKRLHLRLIDLGFALGLPPGWRAGSNRVSRILEALEHVPYCSALQKDRTLRKFYVLLVNSVHLHQEFL